MSAQLWLVSPTGLPRIRRRCLRCPSAYYRTYGKFRVNANHKLLDVWLLALCTGCGETIKLTVRERVNVRTIEPATLDGFHGNDLALAARTLREPGLLRRNGIALDWDGAWTVQAPTPTDGEVDVHFVQPIPISRTKLLSSGLGVSRAEVLRLIADGRLTSAHRLDGRSSAGFGFTLKR